MLKALRPWFGKRSGSIGGALQRSLDRGPVPAEGLRDSLTRHFLEAVTVRGVKVFDNHFFPVLGERRVLPSTAVVDKVKEIGGDGWRDLSHLAISKFRKKYYRQDSDQLQSYWSCRYFSNNVGNAEEFALRGDVAAVAWVKNPNSRDFVSFRYHDEFTKLKGEMKLDTSIVDPVVDCELVLGKFLPMLEAPAIAGTIRPGEAPQVYDQLTDASYDDSDICRSCAEVIGDPLLPCPGCGLVSPVRQG